MFSYHLSIYLSLVVTRGKLRELVLTSSFDCNRYPLTQLDTYHHTLQYFYTNQCIAFVEERTTGFSILQFLLPTLLSLLGSFLGHLLLSRNSSLDANAAKDERDTQPLHLRETMAESKDRENHGKHLSSYRDSDEKDR